MNSDAALGSEFRSPFKVGDRVIRKYDGKVGEVAGIDVKGRLTVYFKDGTSNVLPAMPETFQRSAKRWDDGSYPKGWPNRVN